MKQLICSFNFSPKELTWGGGGGGSERVLAAQPVVPYQKADVTFSLTDPS